ncbi:skin secretory protein xP2-like [Panicum virgatum]|uniref:skin secretory protein xP2-like n=1 Tax=Panicum virgatum TaxID=38727 RepID=UPI0019D5F508|nr:skin secretory protein xP2-like [Panicum virgatum]
MLLHRAAPAAVRRPANSPAASERKVQGGGGRRGAPEPCPRAAVSPALLRARLRCLPPAPTSPDAAELEAAGEGPLPGALEVERRSSRPNPGEGGGRAADGARPAAPLRPRVQAAGEARPAMATVGARAGGSTVPPWFRHGLRRRHSRAPLGTRGTAAA